MGKGEHSVVDQAIEQAGAAVVGTRPGSLQLLEVIALVALVELPVLLELRRIR